MKIEKISAIAEIVSSAAIVITLAYLAVQTGQNASALNATSRQQMLDSELMIIDISRTDPLIPFIRTTEQYRELTREERIRWENWYNMLFRIRENLWLQNQGGVLDDESWAANRGMLLYLISTREIVKQLWDRSVALNLPHPAFADELLVVAFAVKAFSGGDPSQQPPIRNVRQAPPLPSKEPVRSTVASVTRPNAVEVRQVAWPRDVRPEPCKRAASRFEKSNYVSSALGRFDPVAPIIAPLE